MSTQLRIRQDSDEPIVITVHDDEMVQIHLDTHPKTKAGETRAPTFSISGLRWRDGRHFHLGWAQHEIALGTTLRIDYVASDEPISPLVKDVEYVAPDPTCGFCDKPAAEIGLLIKRRYIHFICDSCVDECKEIVDEWRAERDA